MTVNSTKMSIIRQSKKAHNHPPSSAKTIEKLLINNRLILDSTESTYDELVTKYNVNPSRKMKVQRLRRVTKVRSTVN